MHDIKQLVCGLNERALDVCNYLFPNGKRSGVYWVTGDVHDTPASNQGSFKVNLRTGLCRDFNGDEKGYDLLDAWCKRFNIKKVEAIQEVAKFLGGSIVANSSTAKKSVTQFQAKAKAPQRDDLTEYRKKQMSRLRSNPKAMQYLKSRSLSDETIAYFRLGLTSGYKGKDDIYRENALEVPMLSETGEFNYKQNCYYRIPEVTLGMDSPVLCKGKPDVYFTHPYREQKIIFVCEGMKDAWVLYQNLKENNLLKNILVCTSTHGSVIPERMKEDSFWARFETIYLGHDQDSAGDAIAENLLQVILRQCYRVKCPVKYAQPKYDKNNNLKPETEWGADWTDFFSSDSCFDEFKSLLEEAPVCAINTQPHISEISGKQYGRYHEKPIDIRNAYINGMLYYVVTSLVKDVESVNGQEYDVEQDDTVVVRSDRSVHRAYVSRAKKGAKDNQLVYRLTDGTRVIGELEDNPYATWTWPNVQKYLDKSMVFRSTAEIFQDVIGVIRKAVWLPHDDDYYILATTVFLTYIQSVFEAVPYIAMHGQAGTGKSQMGATMESLCCNGTMIGQISAATAARHIDQARGFVVFDDLESVGIQKKKDNSNYSSTDLIQALKVSYQKRTALKMWTNVKTMKVGRLNYYGVKMICNTTGVEEILATRTLTINTRQIPSDSQVEVINFSTEQMEKIEEIRQELHAWAFENCQKADKLRAQQIYKNGRFEEITLPLKVIAEMVSKECCEKLDLALLRQRGQDLEFEDPVEVLKEAAKIIIRLGFISFTATHLIAEMKTLVDENFGKTTKNDIPDWHRAEWVGRKLRSLGFIEDGNLGREYLHGRRLTIMRFNQDVVKEATKNVSIPIEESSSAFSFCDDCSSCPYRGIDCTLRENKLKGIR